MRVLVQLLFTLLVAGPPVLATLPAPAISQPVPGPCVEGVLPSGALSMYCIPSQGWNGDLVTYAHGYVAYNEPIDFYHLTLPDDSYLPDVVQSLGYAFATTSYRKNGLAVLEGADDIRELISGFPMYAGQTPPHTYLAGGSEGGLVTALVTEQSPGLVSGGLAACGPIGSFKKQINYFGDFRVLWDYFFPGVIPPSPISIPQEVIDDWDTVYVPAIESAVAASPGKDAQLISTSNAAIDPKDLTSVATTAVNVLWYNVFGTNDAEAELGGNPYDNRTRIYRGSANDLKLNRNVQRFTADPAALHALQAYETTGILAVPLVTLHTTGDEVIPFWNEPLYLEKVRAAGTQSLLTQIPVVRYGHCNFTTAEVVGAFLWLVFQVTHR